MAIKLANGEAADRPLLTKREIELLINLVEDSYQGVRAGLDDNGYEYLADVLSLHNTLLAKLGRSQARIYKLKYN